MLINLELSFWLSDVKFLKYPFEFCKGLFNVVNIGGTDTESFK